jgi:beta-galactosidase
MKHLIPGLAALALLCACTVETDLTDWQFSKDGEQWENVTVPHSYNALDGPTQKYYRGKAHYRREVAVPRGKTAYLLFEGAAQAAEVYLDGTLLKAHKGGYTPFVVPLPHGGQVEVICDNTEDIEMIPVSSDFNKNGGLHNPVRLLLYDDVYLSPEEYGPYRLHVVQKEVTDDKAVVEVKAHIRNVGNAVDAPVRAVVKDGDGKVVAEDVSHFSLTSGAEEEFAVTLTVDNPHLWNGTIDPYLYTVDLSVGKDAASTEVGFRYFSVDREKGFSLNGKPYPLRGVSMHQDMYGKASALTKEDIANDYAVVKELGCNFLRLAHYPHNDEAFRWCDRMGIIVQTEIPWVNICGVRASEAYFDNIHQQMWEMVTSLYNHPSICFWGMWNELDSWGNRENFQGRLDENRVVAETARLYDYAKSLDPTRCVGLTDDSVFQRDGYTELKADYYSENRYHGWYYNYGDFSGITDEMTWIRDTMGPANISEYGVGINPYCWTWDDATVRRDRTDSLHFEAYGNRSHESHAQQIAQMPWLNFTSLWILFDFPVADRHEGFVDSADGVDFVANPARMYMNDKGLITRDRQTKKDVFYLYKSWWNHDVETVYITGRRLMYRPAGQTFTLTVYSNAPSLTLYRGTEKVAELTTSGEPTGVIWTFPDVSMGTETSTFKVVAPDGTSDEVTWKAL